MSLPQLSANCKAQTSHKLERVQVWRGFCWVFSLSISLSPNDPGIEELHWSFSSRRQKLIAIAAGGSSPPLSRLYLLLCQFSPANLNCCFIFFIFLIPEDYLFGKRRTGYQSVIAGLRPPLPCGEGCGEHPFLPFILCFNRWCYIGGISFVVSSFVSLIRYAFQIYANIYFWLFLGSL